MMELCEAIRETAWRSGFLLGGGLGLAVGVTLMALASALGAHHGRKAGTRGAR